MTTNGVALKRKLPLLKDAGLDNVNISLDTLDPLQFELITRRKGFKSVMESIREALELRLPSVKINVVVIKNLNAHHICNFVALTKDLDLNVRFIEYMPFDGNAHFS